MASRKKRPIVVGAGAVGLVCALALIVIGIPLGPSRSSSAASSASAVEATGSSQSRVDPLAAQSIEVSAAEFERFKVQPVAERVFNIDRDAVGNIDFNQEMSVAVFPPVSGKMLTLFARAGDDVQKGMPLYTIDSPDLVQAESTPVAAAGVLEMDNRALKRARQLYEAQGISQKDLDQAVADQQGAEAALRAARDAVRIFGKTDKEMDRIIGERKVDAVLVVASPITGRVAARNAAPGSFAMFSAVTDMLRTMRSRHTSSTLSGSRGQWPGSSSPHFGTPFESAGSVLEHPNPTRPPGQPTSPTVCTAPRAESVRSIGHSDRRYLRNCASSEMRSRRRISSACDSTWNSSATRSTRSPQYPRRVPLARRCGSSSACCPVTPLALAGSDGPRGRSTSIPPVRPGVFRYETLRTISHTETFRHEAIAYTAVYGATAHGKGLADDGP